jgi:hypothetical protein
LVKGRIYRMSGIVVVIGYLLLLPGLGIMLMGVLGLAGTGTALNAIDSIAESEIRTDLQRAAVHAQVTESIMAGNGLTPQMTQSLSLKQKQVVASTQSAILAQSIGKGAVATAGSFVSLCMMFGGFTGTLVGWLLVMKKRVLQCPACTAVVAAC